MPRRHAIDTATRVRLVQVYVVEVWGESKRLAVSLRRYNDFYSLRDELLAKLMAEDQPVDADKIRKLPFPQKLDMGVTKTYDRSFCCTLASHLGLPPWSVRERGEGDALIDQYVGDVLLR